MKQPPENGLDNQQLYNGIVDLCQERGFTTEHTYDLIHQVVESIFTEPDEPNTTH